MRAHIFATSRGEPLANWLAAFPTAQVVPGPGALKDIPSGSAVVWLHLAIGSNEMAGLCQGIHARAPHCPIVVLSNRPAEAEGLKALEAGAAGYASALAAPEVLHQVADVVENGGFWVGKDLMHRLLTALARSGGKREVPGLDKLTARERDVALAVAAGASNKEISSQLDITERTVKSHLSAIFHILGVRDRLQLSVLINGVPRSGGKGMPRRPDDAGLMQ